jgi:hypothetical protein
MTVKHVGDRYSVDEAIEKSGFGRFQWLLFYTACMSRIADSMEVMMLGFILPILQKEWRLNAVQLPLIGCSVFIVR